MKVFGHSEIIKIFSTDITFRERYFVSVYFAIYISFVSVFVRPSACLFGRQVNKKSVTAFLVFLVFVNRFAYLALFFACFV